jgi:hypothetical protein
MRSFVLAAALGIATLFASGSTADARPFRGGGYHAGVYRGGGWSGYHTGYGWGGYRGFGWNRGYGWGGYRPYYGGYWGVYAPWYGSYYAPFVSVRVGRIGWFW